MKLLAAVVLLLAVFANATEAQAEDSPAKLPLLNRLEAIPQDTIRTIRNVLRIIIQVLVRVFGDSVWALRAVLDQVIDLLKDIRKDLIGEAHQADPLIPFRPPPRVKTARFFGI